MREGQIEALKKAIGIVSETAAYIPERQKAFAYRQRLSSPSGFNRRFTRKTLALV